MVGTSGVGASGLLQDSRISTMQSDPIHRYVFFTIHRSYSWPPRRVSPPKLGGVAATKEISRSLLSGADGVVPEPQRLRLLLHKSANCVEHPFQVFEDISVLKPDHSYSKTFQELGPFKIPLGTKVAHVSCPI